MCCIGPYNALRQNEDRSEKSALALRVKEDLMIVKLAYENAWQNNKAYSIDQRRVRVQVLYKEKAREVKLRRCFSFY